MQAITFVKCGFWLTKNLSGVSKKITKMSINFNYFYMRSKSFIQRLKIRFYAFRRRTDQRKKSIRYTWKHKLAFLELEKEKRGFNTWHGYLHDLDKLLFRHPFMLWKTSKEIQKDHRQFSKHHAQNKSPKEEEDYINMVFDWECASKTKKDKPLLAFGTMLAYYPDLEKNVMPIIIRFNLLTEEAIDQAVNLGLITKQAALAKGWRYGLKF